MTENVLVRRHTKPEVLVDGRIQRFTYTEDNIADFIIHNKTPITDIIQSLVRLQQLDSLGNGCSWVYASSGSLSLRRVIQEEIQDDFLIDVNLKTGAISFATEVKIGTGNNQVSYATTTALDNKVSILQNNITSTRSDILNILNNKKWVISDITDFPSGTLVNTVFLNDKLTALQNLIIENVSENFVKSVNIGDALENTGNNLSLNLNVKKTSVIAGDYANPIISVDQYGRITSASSGSSSSIPSYTPVSAERYTAGTSDDFLAINTSSNKVNIILPNESTIGKTYTLADVAGYTSNLPIQILGDIQNPNKLIADKILSTGATPTDAVITPNGELAYIVNKDQNSVSVIGGLKALAPTLLKTINVGLAPKKIALSPDGNYAYILNSNSNTITILKNAQTTNPTVLKTLTVGSSPSSIVFTQNGLFAYVANALANTVSMIQDAQSNNPTVRQTLVVGTTPICVVLTPDENLLYVANYGTNTVSVFESANTYYPAFVKTITVALSPYSMLVHHNGEYLYIYCADTIAKLSVISYASTANIASVLTTITISNVSNNLLNQKCILLSEDGNYLYIANSGANNISVLQNVNTSDPTILKTIETGTGSNQFIYSNDKKYLLVANTQYGISIVQNPLTNSSYAIVGMGAESQPNAFCIIPGSYYFFATLTNGRVAMYTPAQVIADNFTTKHAIYLESKKWFIF